MATKPTLALLSAALVLGGTLAGCSFGSSAADPTPSATAATTPTSEATPTPDPTPSATPTADTDTDAVPRGFPDPATLIGQEAHDEQAADGTWHTVVGGVPLDLVSTFGACFDGGTADVCAYSISGAVVPGPVTQPTTAGLLLLLRANGTLADGSVTWTVLDAVVTVAPGGEPAYFETCEGPQGVAIYADPDAAPGATVPALAAWGPDAALGSLVELDPASLTCAYVGD